MPNVKIEYNTVSLPLTGEGWELIVSLTGDIFLARSAPITEYEESKNDPSGEPMRTILELGEIGEHIQNHDELIKAFNVLRSGGLSENCPH